MLSLKGLHAGGRAKLFGVFLVFASSALGIPAAAFGDNADDAYLDHLRGSWVMEGTYAGKPVRYRADGQRVLKGGFLKIHMIDAASPSSHAASAKVRR